MFPKFQRRDAWSKVAKSKFIESLILGLPIPQIILAEKKSERGRYIVIDGKQRLLTIRQFFANIIDDEFTPFKLSGLEVLPELNRKSYQDLKNDPAFSQILNQLYNQTIRTTVIKNWPNEEFLFTVFLRLNTGSIKLSPQELRQALHPGAFIDFTDSFSIESEAIKVMLKLKQPDYRMRDVEMVIRFFTYKYFIELYEGNLKKAFDNTVQILNDNWDEKSESIIKDSENLEKAIVFTNQVFGPRNAFSKWSEGNFQGNFNRAIFDIMVYYFSNPQILNLITDKKQDIINAFKTTCEKDIEFITSFEHTTKSIKNTGKRFSVWGEEIARIINKKIQIPVIENNGLILKFSKNGEI